MDSNNEYNKEREVPHSHLIQGLSPISFLIIWGLDSYVFFYSVFLNMVIPFFIRFVLFLFILIFALLLIFLSHRTLFDENNHPLNTLITEGILKYVRNPLYLGVLFIYISFLFLSISVISIVIFIIIFLIYNRMVNYEENLLEQLFGEEYLEYKKKTSKWVPFPFK